VTTQTQERFGDAYFEAGVLRNSRSLTQSAYDGVVFSWLRRRHPDVLNGQGRRALEIGCGYGYCCELLEGFGFEVIGTDISPHAIDRARSELHDPNIDFTVWDATKEPIFEGQFSLVVAFEVVEHLDDPEGALRAWRALLKPGGLLALTTPNRFGPAARHWRDPTHVNVRSHAGWRRALRDSGPWTDVAIDAIQGIPYLWRWTNVIQTMPMPILGATLRVCARKP
jgi:2-polyprenyl-3-methyl-5-hydroxy-6-metoxy-1,4-benzoquinol methylase